MRKKIISNCCLIIIIFISELLCFLGYKALKNINIFNPITNFLYQLLTVFLIIVAIIVPIFTWYSLSKNKNRYPAESTLNILNKNIVELHIGDKSKGNPDDFYLYAARTILQAKSENKDILFFTSYFEPKRIKSYLGQAVILEKAKGLNKYSNLIMNWLILQLNKRKYNLKLEIDSENYLMGYVETSKLSNTSIERLQRVIKRAERNN